jgi:hypothetical protein
MKEKETQEKLHELINIIEIFFNANNLNQIDLMYFHMCSVASLMKQMDSYTTNDLVKGINVLLDELNSTELK